MHHYLYEARPAVCAICGGFIRYSTADHIRDGQPGLPEVICVDCSGAKTARTNGEFVRGNLGLTDDNPGWDDAVRLLEEVG